MKETATRAMREGRFADALATWETMVRDDGPLDALIGRAEALAALARVADAAQAFAEAAARFPERPEGPCGVARIAYRIGDLERAATAAEEALRRAPDHVPSLVESGRILLKQDRVPAAEARFRHAAACAPDRPEPLFGLAGAATHCQDWETAVTRWRRIWDRFRHPAAPHEIIVALAHLDRADAAKAFLAAIPDAQWTSRRRLTAWSTLARLQQDWEGLAALLEDQAAIVATDRDLRLALIEGLSTLGRIDAALDLLALGTGHQSVDQALTVRTLLIGDRVEDARRMLRRIAPTPAMAQLSPRLLPDLLAALREGPEPAGARRLLDRIAGDHRMPPDMKLAARFERDLDDCLAALAGPDRPLPAADGMPEAGLRDALAADGDTPLGPTANRAVLERACDAMAMLRGRHPNLLLLDAQTSLAAALAVGEHLARAIADRRPYAAIRLGDGEGNFLPYRAEDERHRRRDQATVQRVWWSRAARGEADLRRVERELAAAIRQADMVGVPDLYRICQALAGPKRLDQTSRGLLAVIDQFAAIAPAPEEGTIDRPGQIVTTCHFHNAFAFWRIWDVLLGRLGHCALVTGRDELADAVQRQFGLEVTRVHPVPPERKYGGTRAAGAHFPDRFDGIRDELEGYRAGDVVLVAAGILGKVYCGWIRQAGGIAIDIGSAADHWCGQQTRNVSEAATFRPPSDLARRLAARPDLDDAYPTLRPSAYFRDRG